MDFPWGGFLCLPSGRLPSPSSSLHLMTPHCVWISVVWMTPPTHRHAHVVHCYTGTPILLGLPCFTVLQYKTYISVCAWLLPILCFLYFCHTHHCLYGFKSLSPACHILCIVWCQHLHADMQSVYVSLKLRALAGKYSQTAGSQSEDTVGQITQPRWPSPRTHFLRTSVCLYVHARVSIKCYVNMTALQLFLLLL